MTDHITIPTPRFAYKGPTRTDADQLRTMADHLERGMLPGSNVRNGCANLLRNAAEALDGNRGRLGDAEPAIGEMTAAERYALPAKYHQPVWGGTGTPNTWYCRVCWDEDEITAWPCDVARRDGAEVAYAGGMEHHV